MARSCRSLVSRVSVQRPGTREGTARMVCRVPKRRAAGGHQPRHYREAAHVAGWGIEPQYGKPLYGARTDAPAQGASGMGLDRQGARGAHVSDRKERTAVSDQGAVCLAQEALALT